jgi:hypothetical protein
MDLDDFVEPEVGMAVAVTAAVATVALSSTVRGWLRKGAVYGLAGVLMAKDRVTGMARTVRERASHDGGAHEPGQPHAEQRPEGATA